MHTEDSIAKKKLLVVLGRGGHTAETVNLLHMLGTGYEFVYLVAFDDHTSLARVPVMGKAYRTVRPRQRQKTRRSVLRTLIGFIQQFFIYWQVRPDAIIGTGPGIMVPISIWGRLFGSKIIFIETASRVYDISFSGQIMYRIAHLFFVQWENLVEKYPKAIYAGRLL
jgi:beta-1,4-N-acetylglucosaminyltransferase